MPVNTPRANATQQKFAAYFVFLGCLIGGLVCGYYATFHIRSYVRMGNAPEQLTATELLQIPLDAGAHWVLLKDDLLLDCQNALQQLSNGSVEFTEYMGHDEAGHTFFLQYKGDPDCKSASSRPLEGLLKESPIYWWTKNNMPAPSSQSVEIRVGYLPTEELWEGLAAAVVAIFLLGLFGLLVFKRPKPKAAAGTPGVYHGVAIPKGL
jgi:hypothetical protein